MEFERVKSKKNGFTLIETLVVLVIIGVMASFTISGFNNIYLDNFTIKSFMPSPGRLNNISNITMNDFPF